jgi:hypothetical protein
MIHARKYAKTNGKINGRKYLKPRYTPSVVTVIVAAHFNLTAVSSFNLMRITPLQPCF